MKRSILGLFKKAFAALLVSLTAVQVFSHGSVNSYESGQNRQISFPDTSDYLTISSDLHTHSVFSDGHVWPNIRVSEALKDGIDSIAITEHLEYQPHTLFIPNNDRNSAYIEAEKAAEGSDLIVIAGSEITREMPPGHLNAVFISDANKLFKMDKKDLPEARKRIREVLGDVELPEEEREIAEKYALGNIWSPFEALEEANKQGAFVFWNHPMWGAQASDGIARVTEMHKMFIKQNLMHGIEIVNTYTYSEEAFSLALENDLTLIGTSDVHNLIEWDYDSAKNEHRPVTLIFAKDRTADSMKQALFAGRTVVFFKNRLIGKEENLIPLLNSVITIDSEGYRGNSEILTLKLKNNSTSSIILQNISEYSFANFDDIISIPKNGQVTLIVKTLEILETIDLSFNVLNALVKPKVNAKVSFRVEI